MRLPWLQNEFVVIFIIHTLVNHIITSVMTQLSMTIPSYSLDKCLTNLCEKEGKYHNSWHYYHLLPIFDIHSIILHKTTPHFTLFIDIYVHTISWHDSSFLWNSCANWMKSWIQVITSREFMDYSSESLYKPQHHHQLRFHYPIILPVSHTYKSIQRLHNSADWQE